MKVPSAFLSCFIFTKVASSSLTAMTMGDRYVQQQPSFSEVSSSSSSKYPYHRVANTRMMQPPPPPFSYNPQTTVNSDIGEVDLDLWDLDINAPTSVSPASTGSNNTSPNIQAGHSPPGGLIPASIHPAARRSSDTSSNTSGLNWFPFICVLRVPRATASRRFCG